jgi:Domain of unknown function (DUF4919)
MRNTLLAFAGWTALAVAPIQVAANADTESRAASPGTASPARPASLPKLTHYDELRLIASRQAGFNGYKETLEEREAMATFMADWNIDRVRALADARAYLASHPHSLAANRLVAEALEARAAGASDPAVRDRDNEMARRLRADHEGLARSVMASGDGRTCATAWKVIAVGEEYEVLRYLKLDPDKQSLVHGDPGICDCFSTHDDSGLVRVVHFDIGSFFGKMPD